MYLSLNPLSNAHRSNFKTVKPVGDGVLYKKTMYNTKKFSPCSVIEPSLFFVTMSQIVTDTPFTRSLVLLSYVYMKMFTRFFNKER